MSAQPEALRIATRAERIFKVLEGNETVPTMRVMEFMLEAAVELRRLQAEVLEQCRLNGMGSEREAKLMAENEALQQKLRSTEKTLQRGREAWIASAEAWSRDVAEKNALLRQALELLEDNREDVARVETTYMHKCYDPVLHAIKRHLENGS